MTECMSIGSAGKLAIQGGSTPRTFNGSSERYDFLYETLTKKQRRVGNRGIKGDLSEWKERNVEGASMISGVVAFNASPEFMYNFMPRIIGSVTNGDNADGDPIYEPGTSLPSFDVLIYREAKTFHYKECYVNRCIIRGENVPSEDEPEVITVVLQLIGKERVTTTAWPDPEPALGLTVNSLPDIMGTSVLTLDSTEYAFDRFVLSIDHSLIVKFRNNLTISCIRPGMRKVRLQTNNPFLSASFDALHDTLDSPIGGTLVFSRDNGADDATTTFTFGTLDNMGEDPNIRGKTEIQHVLDFQALRNKTDDVPEITGVTHKTAVA